MDGGSPGGIVEGAAQGLAVQGDHVSVGAFIEEAHPGGEAGGEVFRVNAAQDAGEGVVRGDAVQQGDVLAEPVQAGAGEVGDGRGVFGPAEHGAQGAEEDVEQSMRACALHPWVGKVSKCAQETVLG